ncbi:hypothetical protein N657DRAFT_671156 [Parathielavia appendiculata]|uniref:Uncharacterized protein n=1 Tax=Parathielavia appendiculata TaxID=2587402 RepID=A0AAN6U2N3_9PEZI|nr:hypothetical protein N657DRAFT_671156 [Parathielavia appendiculata]
MLATEDDCLGIDFNPLTPAVSQVMRSSTEAIAAAIESTVRALIEEHRQDIFANPELLVWLYVGPFLGAAACHIELLYFAANGASSTSRMPTRLRHTAVPHIATWSGDAPENTSNHMRYINTSLENVRRLNQTNPWRRANNASTSEHLIADLEHFAGDLGKLKSASGQCFRPQVSKKSLQEARVSMREARDLKWLSYSYLGFIFVPLSLPSSYFSMQIEPLGNTAPLWVFIVTALAILAFSISIMFLTSSARLRRWWEGLKDDVWNLAHGGVGNSVLSIHPRESWELDGITKVARLRNRSYLMSLSRRSSITKLSCQQPLSRKSRGPAALKQAAYNRIRWSHDCSA